MSRLSVKLLVLSGFLSAICLSGCPPAPSTPDLPVAAFTATPQEGVAPLAVQFTDTSVAGASPIVSWQWDFGDGEKSSRPNPRKTYQHDPESGNLPSRYTVKLTVTTARGSNTKVMQDLITVNPGTVFEVIDPASNPYVGSVSVSGVTITVPQGALDRKTVFGVRCLDQGVPIDFFEPMEIVSCSYEITHDNPRVNLFALDGTGLKTTTLDVPLLPNKIALLSRDPAKFQLLAITQDGRTIPVMGALVGNMFRANVTGLPQKSVYVAVYRPEAFNAEISVSLPESKSNTGFDWKTRWHINVSQQMLQQLTALRLGTIDKPSGFNRRDYSPQEMQATADSLGQALVKLHLEFALSGFRSPVLSSADDAYSLTFYNINSTYTTQYSSFQKLTASDRTFGSLVIDPRQLLAVSQHNADAVAADSENTDTAQKYTVPNLFAHDLFLSSFEGYGFPNITLTNPLDVDSSGNPKVIHFLEGLRQGAAVYLGQWADATTAEPAGSDVWARGFESNEYYLLSDVLFQPYDQKITGYAAAGQEFFVYAQKALSEQPMSSLVPLLAYNGGPVRGILEELRVTFAEQDGGGAALPLEKALTLSYAAIDRSVTAFSQGAKRLPELYWDFVRDRAVENGPDGILRQADTLLASYTLKDNRIAMDSLLDRPLAAATDTTQASSDSTVSLKNIAPLSTRIVAVHVNPLASELTLTFNADEWVADATGNSLQVVAYKMGETRAVSLEEGQDTDEDDLPDTLVFRSFPQDPEDCYAKVIVVISNLSLNTFSSLDMTAESFAGLPVSESSVLHKYVNTCDPNYAYELVSSGTLPSVGATSYVLHMTSGAWRGKQDVNQTIWEHYITILEPPVVTSQTSMLLISGGSTGSTPNPTEVSTLLLPFALATGSVVSLIQAVPNEPLIFDGETKTRSEDAIIAYSYDEYMTGYTEGKPDMTWPALLPMTRAAVRAMDTVQDFMGGKSAGSVPINDFVVAGASKRGWTTWLTAAVDDRVRAVVPIVIDVLNMDVQMVHHHNAYGFYSSAIQDYVSENVFDRLSTPEGTSLLKIVDPYEYLDRLTMPKFIANSTGDQFFLPDSSQFYFNQLKPSTTLPNGVKYPEDTYIYYAPNTDHGLQSSTGLGVDKGTLSSILAFYTSIIGDLDRPQYTWWVEQDTSAPVNTRSFRIRLDSVTKPKSVLLWQATNTDGRDFRLETIGADWVSSPLTPFCDECGGDPGFVTSTEKCVAQKAAVPEALEVDSEKLVIGGSGSRTTVGSGADAIPLVVVSGTPYQMGYHYGELMRNEIQTFVPSMLSVAQSLNATQFSNENLDSVWNAMLANIDYRFIKELQGVADGAQIPLDTLRRAHMIPVVSDYSCSSVAVWGSASANGHLYQSRDLDWDLQFGAQNYPCIVVYNPAGGIPHANVGFAGLVGSHCGINAEGVTLAEIGDSPISEYPYNYNGNHFMPMFREILYDANSLTEALNILQNTPRIKRYHYVFGDGRHENRAVKIKAHAPELPPNDLLIWSDNDSSDEYAPNVLPDVVYHDEHRGAFGHLKANSGQYDSAKLIALANAIPILGKNVMNVVFDATALTMWVAYAEGPQQQAFQRPYVAVDLSEYFAAVPEGEGQVEGQEEGQADGEGALEGEEEGQTEGEEEGECACTFRRGEVRSYAASVPVPDDGKSYTAFFVQVIYPGPDPESELLKDVDYVFSSRVVVVPNVYPETTEIEK